MTAASPAPEALIQIAAPHFCAGAVLSDDRVSRSAPILAWMRGQSLDQMRVHCRRKRWLLTIEHADGSWEFDP
jgi:hypothetical protein